MAKKGDAVDSQRVLQEALLRDVQDPDQATIERGRKVVVAGLETSPTRTVVKEIGEVKKVLRVSPTSAQVRDSESLGKGAFSEAHATSLFFKQDNSPKVRRNLLPLLGEEKKCVTMMTRDGIPDDRREASNNSRQLESDIRDRFAHAQNDERYLCLSFPIKEQFEIPGKDELQTLAYRRGVNLRDIVFTKGREIIESVRNLKGAALGLSLFHENGMTHRDIKGDNVFSELNDLPAALGDFGCASSDPQQRLIGHRDYRAPELCPLPEQARLCAQDGEQFCPEAPFTTACDIYSFGVMMRNVFVEKLLRAYLCRVMDDEDIDLDEIYDLESKHELSDNDLPEDVDRIILVDASGQTSAHLVCVKPCADYQEEIELRMSQVEDKLSEAEKTAVNHYLALAFECMSLHPEARPTAEELAARFSAIESEYPPPSSATSTAMDGEDSE